MTDLEPGPELDALVAEKVMGATMLGPYVYGEGKWWQIPGLGRRYIGPDDDWEIRLVLWHPGTDMNHALEVAEKLASRGWSYTFQRTCLQSSVAPHSVFALHEDVYPPVVGNKGVITVANCELPHAICLAALEAQK